MEWPRAQLILQQALLWAGMQAAGMTLAGAEAGNSAGLTVRDLRNHFCPFFLLTVTLRVVV